ncbi:ATP-binding protein [Candidatus Palauibacter sp.]|uniref:ATP-binding protein n=1 Tax=Candidatus Palauibacter sp. TaxID=3101350 RepID=UPI003B5C2493
MTFDENEIRRRLRLGQDSHWEFEEFEFRGDRPARPDGQSIADELAAFANARGGAMLCGVTDAGEVQGMTRRQLDALEQLVVNLCTDSVKPPIEIDTSRGEIDGKPLLIVEVPPGYALHESPGGAFRRLGSSKRRMTSDESLRLAQRWSQARFLWFDEQPVPGTGFRTLDKTLWGPLLSSEGAADPKLALEKMGLLARDEGGILRATVAGVLLCAAAPEEWLPNACISATQYRGVDQASGQLDAHTITGPLHRQIAEAVRFAVRNMRVGAHKQPARVDLPQYSERALFEAVVNAVAHRDYSIRGSRIRLSMFADRIEINSPGALPNNLTVESMASRQATRNQTLASMLGRIPAGKILGSGGRQFFMERRGDGVPTIMRETRRLSGEEPLYRVVDDADLFLTIPAAPTTPTPATALIRAHEAGAPLPGIDLLVLFPNETWRAATTGESGEVTVDLYATELPLTVFAAAAGYAAHVETEWIPSHGPLDIELSALPAGRSAIFRERTGEIPGLRGSLNPIRDKLDRTYLYASNLAIDEGRREPVDFFPGEELRVTDPDGAERLVRTVSIVGQSALVEYRPTPDA